jgi:hypothetical protein
MTAARKRQVTPDEACDIVKRCADHDDSPEAELWIAVLNRALLDTWVAGEYEKAKAFIASSRAELACDFAGVDIDFFRDIAKRVEQIPQDIVTRWKKAKATEHAKARMKRKLKRGTL